MGTKVHCSGILHSRSFYLINPLLQTVLILAFPPPPYTKGRTDTLVKPHHTAALLAAYGSSVKRRIVVDGGHNTGRGALCLEEISNFIFSSFLTPEGTNLNLDIQIFIVNRSMLLTLAQGTTFTEVIFLLSYRTTSLKHYPWISSTQSESGPPRCASFPLPRKNTAPNPHRRVYFTDSSYLSRGVDNTAITLPTD